MAPKKTNIKIKRSKINLYNKKKSKARRALKIVITVIVVCGLAVLGYGLGKPLIKYLQEKNNSDPGSEASALLSSIINSQSAVSTVISTGSSEGDTSTPEAIPQAPRIFYLSDNAALSEENLAAALADAKSSGCSVVAVTLKDTSGYLLYKSALTSVKDNEINKGTLSASQIAAKISGEGLTPAARINTLMDATAPAYIEGGYRFAESQGGYTWHDNKVEKGGKLWLSPFNSVAVEYISSVSEELSKAGFKHIICANTRFPNFHTVDVGTYLNHLPLKDYTKRAEALWSVLDAAKNGAEKNGAKLIVEVSASAVLATNKSCSDAELLNKNDKLSSVSFIVNYDITKTAANQTTSSSGSQTSTTSRATSSAASAPTSAPTSAPETSQTAVTSTVTVRANAAAGTTSSSTSGSTKIDYTGTPGALVKTVPAGKTEYETAKDFAQAAKTAFGSASFSVRLPQTLTGDSRKDVSKALSEADIAVIQ